MKKRKAKKAKVRKNKMKRFKKKRTVSKRARHAKPKTKKTKRARPAINKSKRARTARGTVKIKRPSVRRSAGKALKHVSAQSTSSAPAFTALKRDVHELKALETRVARMDQKFEQKIQHVGSALRTSDRKTQEAISRLATRTANAISAVNENFNDKLNEKGNALEEKISDTRAQLKITAGNHERRISALEDAVMQMHEAVEELNENWRRFTESLLTAGK